MYTRVANIWQSFRSSFWFVPSILMIAATVSAAGMIRFDTTFGRSMVETYPILEMSPPAARSILSAIVAAMVSTTGVVFSITIVALSLASSHFGSRLIRTYRNRNSTHFTLGIFVSTSLYCVLVLASIRETADLAFVPSASVAVGIGLSVICLAALIFYIHDTSRAIQAPNVIEASANDLHSAIERLFPESIGAERESQAGRDDDSSRQDPFDEAGLGTPQLVVSCNDRVGYLQAIEEESVMAIADEHRAVIQMRIRPGDFLFDGKEVATVWYTDCEQEGQAKDKSGDTICSRLNSALIIGAERTHIQDVRHAFDELVDIAVRALSPGVNDPFTAINCVDRIYAALRRLQSRKIPSRYRTNQRNKLRVIADSVTLQECIDGSLGVINSYANDSPTVRERIEQALSQLIEREE